MSRGGSTAVDEGMPNGYRPANDLFGSSSRYEISGGSCRVSMPIGVPFERMVGPAGLAGVISGVVESWNTHAREPFAQFRQDGFVSSHLTCRCLQIKLIYWRQSGEA